MRPICNLLLAFVLLTATKSAPSTDPYELLLILNPQPTDTKPKPSDQSQDLATQLHSLRRNVSTALSTIQQQGEMVLNLIDVHLKQIGPTDNSKSCGTDHVCVQKNLCRSEPLDNNGNFKIRIHFRVEDEPCNYWQTCCHHNNTMESKPNVHVAGKCGIRHVNGIAGTLEETRNMEAEFGEFPWMVAIMLGTSPIGGGSLIAPNIVVTSANKVDKLNPNDLIVRAGEWDIESEDELYPHVDRTVKQLIVHERFSRQLRNNDIALLVLKVHFTSQPNIAPICLPTLSDKFDLQRCIVTGWGKKDEASMDLPHVLKEISLNVLPQSLCNTQLSAKLKEKFQLDPTSICAGGEKDVDACLGDGGAPLVCPIQGSPNRYKLAGIVAWGIGCGMENVPSAFTNVAALTPWISEKLMQLNVDSGYYTA